MQDPRHRDPDRRLHLARWARAAGARVTSYANGETTSGGTRGLRLPREVVEPRRTGASSASADLLEGLARRGRGDVGVRGSRRPPGKAICPDHGIALLARALDEQQLRHGRRAAGGRPARPRPAAAARRPSARPAPGGAPRCRARICGRSSGSSVGVGHRGNRTGARAILPRGVLHPGHERRRRRLARAAAARARARASSARVRVVVPDSERSWIGKAISRWDELRGDARSSATGIEILDRRRLPRGLHEPGVFTRCSTRRPSSSSRA